MHRVAAIVVVLVMLASGFGPGAAASLTASEPCSQKNGDVNADGRIDVSDAITVLGHLFLGRPAELLAQCARPSLPDTGQTRCYDSSGEVLCGSRACTQDADYLEFCPGGGAPRFVDNGNRTVTDQCTGLMWMKEAWDFNTWCFGLRNAEDIVFAGHDDWRIPNIRELLSLVSYGTAHPTIGAPFQQESANDTFWSSTTYDNGPDRAWAVSFDDGSFGPAPKDKQNDIRPVRNTFFSADDQPCTSKNGDINGDGVVDISDPVTLLGNLFLGTPAQLHSPCSSAAPLPATGQQVCYDSDGPRRDCPSACYFQDGDYWRGCPYEGRFVDNKDGTVTDTCTRLMWQKDSKLEVKPWCDALLYCEELVLAGHDDWRLPNIRELESLLVYGRSRPTIDPLFDNRNDYPWYWSSTTVVKDPRLAWVVEFSVGVSQQWGKVTSFGGTGLSVRAVRNTGVR
jgi:hypothetical protein